jgi:hypothetical protein
MFLIKNDFLGFFNCGLLLLSQSLSSKDDLALKEVFALVPREV